ncbi:cation/H(+) antiporter 24-like [Carya illinoinensis]|uniref:Cation/H+ exchanger domain-containing protein n=2 Tax=Carya illinoinensis TaxID=32201 RepID=A0A922DBP0_CARIL|nr:cation/H(+) antiporter 24-like [Carya illinoinensis]KAG6680954.1 hypothetical protein I3842_13G068300 [Carya illinoinensis]
MKAMIMGGETHTFSHVSSRPTAPMICRRTYKAHPFGVFYGANPLDYSFTLVLLEIVCVILLSRLVRFLLKPLKQPRIVSDMIGGIIIGPSVLGRNKKFAAYMFPENSLYVLENVGLIGFMYFLFVCGVKMDPSLIKKAGKKHMFIALIGVTVPTLIVAAVALMLRSQMDKDLALFSSIGAVSSSMGIIAFPSLYPTLQELNLLSSEIGQMALSICLIGDAIGINAIVAFEAAKQGEGEAVDALWYLISLVVLVTFIVAGARRVFLWIIRRTPEGKPVDQGYVVAILLGVCVMAFLTDMLGIAILNGPMWLGLVIPDGPPLGATLVEKSETIIMDLLLPFSFAFLGLFTDVSVMFAAGWSSLAPLFIMAVIGFLSRLLGTLAPCVFFDLPLRDSFALSFILSIRGHVELVLYLHWMDKLMIKQPQFTMMVLLMIMVTGIATPMVRILYDPTKPYMITKRRNIQHTPQDTELGVVLCIHNRESVAGFINLLEASNPSSSRPCSIFALHLIELVGRATPLFFDHERRKVPAKYAAYDTIFKALTLYQRSRSDFVKLHSFTAVSPKLSMYQDICKLALENKAALIILPFHKERWEELGGIELVRAGAVRSVNFSVLDHSPCSVAILVDKGGFRKPFPTRASNHSLHFAVIFLGGADAREALAYADRMAENKNVSLTAVRFLSHRPEKYNEMEKKLDDGLVTWFYVRNEKNNRVSYREVVVTNGNETMAAIKAMDAVDSFDLWIIGRKQGIAPVLLEGIGDWSENQELGVIGDFLASADFGSSASVLVVQQQIMRGS